MRFSWMAVVLGLMISTTASANEPVPRYRLTPEGEATLGQLGLTGLQPVTVEQAHGVRGTGGSAATRGHSFLAGMLIDPQTKSYVFGVDTNGGFATLSQGGLIGPIDPFHVQQSNLALSLEIENYFRGVLMGSAGGTATALFR